MTDTTTTPDPSGTPTPTPADVAKPKGDANGATPKPDETRLPDDHPLVTALARQKTENESLKEKARRLDELEESQKTEADKMADRLKEAESKAEQIPAKVAESLKSHLVGLHEISDEDAELFLTSTDPEVLLKQAARLVEGNQPKSGHVPTQGTGDSGAQVSPYDLGRERALARYKKQ